MDWLLVALALYLGAMLHLIPWISRPTVPLGVSVPSDRLDDPAVTGALTRYRRLVVGVTVLCLVLGLVLARVRVDLAFLIVPLVQLVLGAVAYVRTRRSIIEAKHRHGWYVGVPVRVAASVTETSSGQVRWGWYALALAIGFAGLGYGISVYGRQPDPYPTHTGPRGVPDAWGPKTYWNVLGPQGIAIAMVLLFALLAWAVSIAPVRVLPDGDVAAGTRRARSTRAITQWMLSTLVVVIAAGITIFEVQTWNGITGTPSVVAMVAFLGVTLGVCGVGVWKSVVLSTEQGQAQHEAATAARAQGRRPAPQSPDDDRFWKGGLLYDNPDDPSVFVPKRAGVGYTVNVGSLWGKVFLLALALLVLGSLLLPLLVH